MNKNQNIKQGHKQSEIGILPQDWEVVCLGEVCKLFAENVSISRHCEAHKRSECNEAIRSAPSLQINEVSATIHKNK